MKLARALFVIAALPTVASAFSDRSLYNAPVLEGGGAGRYFTGSRVDGYACSVCHRGATTEDFTIDPLPDHLEAGTRYDVVVHWIDPAAPHALHLELSNPDGSHPTVTVPTTVPRESHCNLAADAPSAIYTVDIGVRRVVGVEACGASTVAVSFVATGQRIDLAVSAVRGDASDTADGDATFERRLTFDAPPADTGGCAATPGGSLLVVAAALLRIRRRRAR